MTESYEVPFYILGFLIRFGPMHGYQLKACLERDINDFTNIKLSNLYYHLGEMNKKGLINSQVVKDNNRLEKEVFSVTALGKSKFHEYFESLAGEMADWKLPLDGILYFSDYVPREFIVDSLNKYIDKINMKIDSMLRHKKSILDNLPESASDMAELIFSHHEIHYRSEREWIHHAMEVFSKEKKDAEE